MHSLARPLSALLVMASVAGFCLGYGQARGQARRPTPAPVPDRVPPRPANNTACNYQDPQDFMIRSNWGTTRDMSDTERRERRQMAQRAVNYRTEQYGYFTGFGSRSLNRSTPMDNAERVSFMGLNVRLNRKIAPVLGCVEQQIRAECTDPVYTPRRLSGIRDRNTYHNGEVSNHVYGIAIDVDPTENTCCMCVAQWGDHPLCQRPVDSIYDRMAMPECWVHVFERFGFYWLGRDRLQDTMHFEFLGDPDRIARATTDAGRETAAGTAPSPAPSAPSTATGTDH
ncbi:MAG: M15 family metallopeptidase [Polyangiales bacterium]|nr:M15 family metallopeptidase [Myxococcales bacterium]MCB9656279.1 M15 family metallopeptidase [Sandaracinaceae bacterium]